MAPLAEMLEGTATGTETPKSIAECRVQRSEMEIDTSLPQVKGSSPRESRETWRSALHNTRPCKNQSFLLCLLEAHIDSILDSILAGSPALGGKSCRQHSCTLASQGQDLEEKEEAGPDESTSRLITTRTCPRALLPPGHSCHKSCRQSALHPSCVGLAVAYLEANSCVVCLVLF